MIYEAKGQGATVEEALAAAKAALNAPETADVHVEILATPQKKILGLFGGKKAEARAFYEIPDAPVKPEKAAKPEKKPAQKQNAPKQNAPKQKAKQPKPEQKAAPQEAPAAAPAQEELVKTPVSTDGKPGVQAAIAYLTAVLQRMGVEKTEVSAFVQADNEILLELDCGDDYGIVIGRRGETLDSIQYLTRLVANRQKTEGEYSRITINVGSYREKRRATLAGLAKKNAEKVRKYGRNFTFEPMNPYERRIIHTTVQGIEGVSSHSVGSDDERRVVITLAEGVKPLNPPRSGRGGRNGGRSRSSRGGNRNSQPQQSVPTRAPKTDAGAEGVSLYGKIN